MHWRRAAHKGGKWAGVAAVVLIVVMYVGGVWWWPRWVISPFGSIMIWRGTVETDWWRQSPHVFWARFYLRRSEGAFEWWPSTDATLQVRWVIIPLWIPFLLLSVPTALLWRADRRAARREKTGHCAACGYDRRGLATDANSTPRCPECGAAPE